MKSIAGTNAGDQPRLKTTVKTNTPTGHRRRQAMGKLQLTFKVEKDTKNTRRYQEEASDGPAIIGTLYV